MKRNLTTALALALGASIAVPAVADVSVYGSLRYGVAVADTGVKGADAQWTLGANRGSRFGIKGSMEAGEGLTAGIHIERNLNAGLSARHHNVSLSGDFGTIKLGRQSAPYYGATTWDGSQTLGGLTDFDPVMTDGSSRATGVSYASNLGGPFSFSVLLGSGVGGADAAGEGVDHINAGTALSAGPVNLSLGFRNDKDGIQRVGGTASASMGPVSLKVGADTGSDSCTVGDDCNDTRFGFHAGFTMGSGNAYTQYSNLDSDDDTMDTDGWVFGYTHVLATNVVAYVEHGLTNDDSEDITKNTTVVALKVGF